MLLKHKQDNRDSGGYPPFPAAIPTGVIEHGRYQVRFARTEAELDAVLRLRFNIFNLELGEGLESSFATGRDEDSFDRVCHHLIVEDRQTSTLVGTYRMQTGEMANAGVGFYSDGEFDLSALPAGLTDQAMEVGRACITREHRNRVVLFLLWRGLARYMETNRLRFLFGCCSLTSQDPEEGLWAMAHLERNDQLHPTLRLPARPGYECTAPGTFTTPPDAYPLPALFRTYLRYGALVCGSPVIDRDFKTIDFFVLFDLESLSPKKRELFFGE
jgi:putative hemolysin